MSVVLAGDFNTKHNAWISPSNDVRGEVLVDMAESIGLAVCNCGSTPPREKDGSQSYINITFVSTALRSRVLDWSVLQKESLSDHNYIAFTLGSALETPWRSTGWMRCIDETKFKTALAIWTPASGTAEERFQDLAVALTRCMDRSTPRKVTSSKRKSVYSWFSHTGELRKISNRCKREHQRIKRLGEECGEALAAANSPN